MAMQSPAAFLQNSANHSAALFRQAFGSLRYQAGAAHPGDYMVAAQSTPNMSVQVSAGMAWVPGSQVANISGTTWDTQADYFTLNDGPVTLTIATADATNPRIDVVYVAVQDSFYAGATNTPVLGVVTGTPAPSPTVPALPANALSLAQVSVVANATSITNSKITASVASMLLANTPIACTSGTHPTGIGVGQPIYETDTGLVQMWTGSVWLPLNRDGALIQRSTATTTTTSGTALQVLTGGQNVTGIALSTGRAYSAEWEGRLGGNGAGMIKALVLGANGALPTTSSAVVGSAQKYLAGSGGPFQIDASTGRRLFQVGAAGTWEFALAGSVPSGASTTASFIADDRGVHSITVYDHGPAPAGLRSI